MFALLFDRRSLLVSGVSLGAIGVLLFTAGLVTGLTLRRERALSPPPWLEYGPTGTTTLAARGVSSGVATPQGATSGTPAVGGAAAVGGPAAGGVTATPPTAAGAAAPGAALGGRPGASPGTNPGTAPPAGAAGGTGTGSALPGNYLPGSALPGSVDDDEAVRFAAPGDPTLDFEGGAASGSAGTEGGTEDGPVGGSGAVATPPDDARVDSSQDAGKKASPNAPYPPDETTGSDGGGEGGSNGSGAAGAATGSRRAPAGLTDVSTEIATVTHDATRPATRPRVERSATPPLAGSRQDLAGDTGGDTRAARQQTADPATARLAEADCETAGGWYVQAGAYAVEANARERSDALEARFASRPSGPRPYFRRVARGSSTLTLVRLGPFADQRQARQAAVAVGDSFVGLEKAGTAAGCAQRTGDRDPRVSPTGTAGD